MSAQVHTAPDGFDQPTAVGSKVGADAPVECKSSSKPQEPQPSSNIRLPLARDYSPCKGGQLNPLSYICKIKKIDMILKSIFLQGQEFDVTDAEGM